MTKSAEEILKLEIKFKERAAKIWVNGTSENDLMVLIDELISESFAAQPLPVDGYREAQDLSHEILLAYGFKKSNEFDMWYLNEKGFAMTVNKDSCWWWNIDDVGDNEGSHWRELKSFQHLQALYLAITGRNLILASPNQEQGEKQEPG